MTTMYKIGPNKFATAEQIALDRVKAEVEAELEQIAAQQAATDRGLRILDIFRNGYQVDGVQKFLTFNEANERQIELTLNPGEEPSPEWFADVLKQQPKLASSFVWKQPVDPYEKKLQEETRRQVFHDVMVELGLSESDANWNLFPKDFLDNLYTAKQAVISGAVRGLMPANPAENAEREEVRIDQENLRLLNSDVRDLKKEVHAGAVQRQQEFKQKEADRVLDIKRQFQDGRFEPLPAHWRGEVLDANFIKRASPRVIRLLREHYGSYQLDMRLRDAA
jgi:hypothetical protein